MDISAEIRVVWVFNGKWIPVWRISKCDCFILMQSLYGFDITF